jgi:hypothetical protein
LPSSSTYGSSDGAVAYKLTTAFLLQRFPVILDHSVIHGSLSDPI